MAYWLFSQTKSTGSFQMLARFKPFVKGAVVDRAIAEERHADAAGLEQLEAIAGAGRLQDAGTDDAAGPHHADFRREQMHAAAAPVRTAGRTAVQLRDELLGGHSLGQRMPMSAMGAEDGVVVFQVGTNADGNGFLTDIRVASAVDQPALMRAGQVLLTAADQQHLPIEGVELFFVQRNGSHRINTHGELHPILYIPTADRRGGIRMNDTIEPP